MNSHTGVIIKPDNTNDEKWEGNLSELKAGDCELINIVVVIEYRLS